MNKKQPMTETAKEYRTYFYQLRKEKYPEARANFSRDGAICNWLDKESRCTKEQMLGIMDWYFKECRELIAVESKHDLNIFYYLVRTKLLDMDIHKSGWAKRHEKKAGLKPIKSILGKLAQEMGE